MDFTKLGFAVLLGCLFITGGYVFWAGMSDGYSELDGAQIYVGNTTELINSTKSTIFAAQQDAQETPGTDDPLGVLLGYFKGAFNAMNTLLSLPNMFITMIGIVFVSMGMFSPADFIYPFVIAAIGMITVIGMMFYLTKVK